MKFENIILAFMLVVLAILFAFSLESYNYQHEFKTEQRLIDIIKKTYEL